MIAVSVEYRDRLPHHVARDVERLQQLRLRLLCVAAACVLRCRHRVEQPVEISRLGAGRVERCCLLDKAFGRLRTTLQTVRHRYRHRHTDTDTDTHTHSQRERETERERQRDRQRDRETDRETETERAPT